MNLNKNIVDRARSIAIEAHQGQVDKCGDPYINHVTNVATRAVSATAYRGSMGSYSQEWADHVVATAWLHDVVEDTDVTLADIALQFPNEVVLAEEAITHVPNEPYWDYIERVRVDEIATAVKIVDLRDNMNPDRIIRITDEAVMSRMMNILIPRYYKAYKLLVIGKS